MPRKAHTFETANDRMKVLGNRIVESTYNGWTDPCTIIFSDETESTKHSPYKIDQKGWTSKPREKEHTFETANAKMKLLGNRIIESTYKDWQEPCTIIFSDGTESTKHKPSDVDYNGYTSKPSRDHTFETANARMKLLGNSIVESTFKGWDEPCTIIFSDGNESTEHTPHGVDSRGLTSKPNPRGQIPHTFETANAKMKLLGNRIIESTYKDWQEPCTIIFSDGTESTKHSPYAVDFSKWKTKPRLDKHTFESANAAMKALGNRIVKSTYISWDKPCTIIFKYGGKSTSHSPCEADSRGLTSKPEHNGFDVNKSGYLYFFAYKVYGKIVAYKIGITNINITNRFSSVNNNLKDKSKGCLKHCVALFYFPDGHKCLAAETIIKQEFERIVIDNVVRGKDEMFSKEGALHAYLFVKC